MVMKLLSRPTPNRLNGNGQARLKTSPTMLVFNAMIALLIVFPMPALLTTLIPGRVVPNGLLLPLAAVGLCSCALLFNPRRLWSSWSDLRLACGRRSRYLATGIVIAAVMGGMILVINRDRSTLEFYVAPGDVTRIAAGDAGAPFTLVIDPHGVEGQFLVAVETRVGAWSQKIELHGPSISVRIPMTWTEVETIQLVDQDTGTVVRALDLVPGS